MSFGNDPSTGTFSPTQNNVDAALKEYYRNKLETILFERKPFFAMVDKKEDVTGRNYDVFVHVAPGGAQSNSFAGSAAGQQLQTAAGNTGEGLFVYLVPKVESHFVANISNKAIYETSSDVGSVVDMVTLIADSQIEAFARGRAIQMYRSADGAIGQVAGSVSGTTLTLSNIADATNFELNGFLDFASSQTGTTVRALASTNTGCQIVALDKINGIMTVKWLGSGTQTLTANNVVVGDFIYQSGNKGTCFNGVRDWIPYGGVSTGDSFLGVDRTKEPSRLAGSFLDGTTGNLEDVLTKALNQGSRLGAKYNTVFCPWGQYTAISNSQSAKVQLVDVVGGDVKIGFRGISVTGAEGRVNILPDNTCPADMMLMTDIDSWQLISVDPVVHLWKKDGYAWHMAYNQAGMELRGYSLANLACHRPIDSCNIRVSPLV